MERWAGRVAVVTGSSAGIGAAICEALVRRGLTVVGAARRVDKTQALADKLKSEKGTLVAVKCDISKDEDVYAFFDTVKKNYGGVDVCINNAAVYSVKKLLDDTPEEWRRLMNVNVVALCLFTKLSVESMRERGVDDGHIINISSVSGHRVDAAHIYCASKFAVRAITEGLRQELREAKSHIRVSEVSPGLVKTEILGAASKNEEMAEKIYEANPSLDARNIADIVAHVLSAPLHVEINEVIVRPTAAGDFIYPDSENK